ncbi:TylF/MycF/NovP-related O-methyltransferase [Flexithrix dorotheae]|uniref:TylF/MycF/NovP-related O-methyltransferase n=1 Tax=Flexithrix dorotheae TaxID=70993 RepID=UPI0003A7B5AB|nr:TylF/MycF/NovP-related O-methyltransferase [Flexithrix dorotheae]
MKKLIANILSSLGYEIIKKSHFLNLKKTPPDIESDEEFMEIYAKCYPFTMSSIPRMYSLYQAVKYTVAKNIPGDFVECGVWKGGSSMIIAHTLMKLGINNRKIYLYDTFDGMSEPTQKDITVRGEDADQLLKSAEKESDYSVWAYSPIEEVKNNLFETSYPKENLVFVKGKVEETIPQTIPPKIALLRLDTDWYESTYHELVHLYPILEEKGALIIDDYGHWQGAREAVDTYFKENGIIPMLNRIDYTGRIFIKN